MSSVVNNKTFYNRKASTSSNNNNNMSSSSVSNTTTTSSGTKRVKKKRMPMPRNHSDSSLKGMLAAQQASSCTGSSGSGFGGSGDGRTENGGTASNRSIKYLSGGSRAQSWCATENSGSQLKLETLFEGQNNISALEDHQQSGKGVNGAVSNNIKNGSNIYGGRMLASPVSNTVVRSGSNTSINNMLTNNSGGRGSLTTPPPVIPAAAIAANQYRNMHNHSALGMVGGGSRKTGGSTGVDMPPILPPRSVSVNGLRSRDEVSRLALLNRFSETSAVEDGCVEVAVDSVDDILARSHLRRSQSENRLSGGHGNLNVFQHEGNENIDVSPGESGEVGGRGNVRHPAGKVGGKGRSLSRNLSVDRLDNLAGRSGQRHKIGISRVGSYNNVNNNNTYTNKINYNNNNNNTNHINNNNNTPGRLRRVSSLSTMGGAAQNGTKSNHKVGGSRRNSNSSVNNNRVSRTTKRFSHSNRNSVLNDIGNQEQDDDTALEDEESIEASARLVEWLNIVNNVEEYDTDPQNTIIDYADEPPQTDTAVHVVYEG